eukprot:GHUV01055013.1.p1 GENE.GHUV01055013.1~~GHUV01055013.1.p1  ORF type:complete len:196 (+),score=48.44 GHUV01055013.1:302-889(+)
MQPKQWHAAVVEDAEDASQSAEARRAENIKDLLSNNLEVQRQPLLSKYLSIKEGEQVLKRAFRSPAPGAPAQSDALRRRLAARKHFVPWGSNKPFTPIRATVPSPIEPQPQQAAAQPPPEDTALPPGVEPLVLWDPAEAGGAGGADDVAVEVDPMLTRWLRPHQRDGVQFMFDCVTGLRLPEGQGENHSGYSHNL